MSILFLLLAGLALFPVVSGFRQGRLPLKGGMYIDRKITPPHYWIFFTVSLLIGGVFVLLAITDMARWLPGLCANLWNLAVCAVQGCELTSTVEPAGPNN